MAAIWLLSLVTAEARGQSSDVIRGLAIVCSYLQFYNMDRKESWPQFSVANGPKTYRCDENHVFK